MRGGGGPVLATRESQRVRRRPRISVRCPVGITTKRRGCNAYLRMAVDGVRPSAAQRFSDLMKDRVNMYDDERNL